MTTGKLLPAGSCSADFCFTDLVHFRVAAKILRVTRRRLFRQCVDNGVPLITVYRRGLSVSMSGARAAMAVPPYKPTWKPPVMTARLSRRPGPQHQSEDNPWFENAARAYEDYPPD